MRTRERERCLLLHILSLFVFNNIYFFNTEKCICFSNGIFETVLVFPFFNLAPSCDSQHQHHTYIIILFYFIVTSYTITHARTHTRTHAHTHARTHHSIIITRSHKEHSTIIHIIIIIIIIITAQGVLQTGSTEYITLQ
jgi:hypothetical protein